MSSVFKSASGCIRAGLMDAQTNRWGRGSGASACLFPSGVGNSQGLTGVSAKRDQLCSLKWLSGSGMWGWAANSRL